MSRNSRLWPKPIDQMGAWLDSEGFYRKHTARDGTCLFRAVAEQLFFTQVYHSDVRRATVEYILRNPHRFQPMVDEPIDEYAERMRSQKEYGGKIEIEAISILYKHDFLIYKEMGQPAEEFTKNGFEAKIVLCNTLDRHFDSVFTKDYIDEAAFVQSIVYEMLYDKVFELKEVDYAVNKMLHDKTYKHQREHLPFIDCFSIRYEMRDNYTNARDLLDFGITPFPYKVAKSLDVEIYRNVEYDTWNDYRKGLRYGFCTWNCRELQVGVKCSIKTDENVTHVGHIQHMSPNKGPVVVYIEKIGEMMTVPYQSLELIPQPPLILPPVRPSSALNMKYANLLSSMALRRGIPAPEPTPRIKRPTKLNLQAKIKKDGCCGKNKVEKQQEGRRESQQSQEANSFPRQEFDDTGLTEETIKPHGYEHRSEVSMNDTLSVDNEGSVSQIYMPMEGSRNHVYVLNPQPVTTNNTTAVQEHRPALFPLPPPVPVHVNLMTQKSVNLDGSDLPHSDLSTLRFCYNLGVDCLRMNYVAWNVRPNSPILVNPSTTLLTQATHSSYMAIDGQYISNDAIAITDGASDDVIHCTRNMATDSSHHTTIDNTNSKKCVVVGGSNDGLIQHPEISSTTPSSPTTPLSPVAFYYQTEFEQPVNVAAPIMEYVYEINSPTPVYPYTVHYVSQDGIVYHPVIQGPAMISQPQHPSI